MVDSRGFAFLVDAVGSVVVTGETICSVAKKRTQKGTYNTVYVR